MQTRESTQKIPDSNEHDAECHLSKLEVNGKMAEDSPAEMVDKSRETAEEAPGKLKLRMGRDSSLHSNHTGLSVASKALPKRRGLISTFVISVGIPLAVTLFIAFSGIWIASRS